MKCSAWSSLAISACSALVLVAPAVAHVTVFPHFIAAGETASLSFTLPNERAEPMTGFSLVVPSELRIVSARSDEGWHVDVQGSRATWRDHSLAPEDEATFILELEAPAEPGPATVQAEQLYPRGATVRWPVYLTVTPATESPSQNIGLGVIVALFGLLVLTSVGVFLWRRLAKSLQEK